MAATNTTGKARLSDNSKFLYDDKGRRVDYDDPRVVHVWPLNTSTTTTRMIGACFNKRGWRFRFPGPTTPDTLQYARKLCSGRECIPCAAIAGDTYKDLLYNREKDEISIYYNLNQDGPCQNGGWEVIWDTLNHRLAFDNTIFMVYPCIGNNFLGQGDIFAIEMAISIALGDIFEEAKTTLMCLAKEEEEAEHLFNRYTDHVVESIPRGLRPLKKALDQWIDVIKKIPLKGRLNEVPKVLLFGGLNVMFIHHPISRFFEEQGMIAKVIDFSEGVDWLTSEYVTRFGLERGLTTPDNQYLTRLFFGFLRPSIRHIGTFLNAFRARNHIWGFDLLIRILRWYVGKTGLLYDEHIPFPCLAEAGHPHASTNGFNETSITVGRYVCSVEGNIFDGLVNVGSFNCQPAMNAQAILRTLSTQYDMPYVSIDSEGPWLSTNQERLLETVAVQAKRHLQERTVGKSGVYKRKFVSRPA